MHHFASRVSATARGGMPARALATAFDAVVFDKDGTLLARRPPRPFPLESGAWVLFSAVVCGGLAWGWALLLKRLAGAVGVL